MQLMPLPHYFIIKIDIEQQRQRREKIGSLYLHCNEIFMQRNMQYGEVVSIGSIAHNQFPEAEVGDTLIVHHFVEGAESEKSNLIYSDEKYNYYNVTASEYNGHRNECYAVYRNNEIIPHPDFIFVEATKEAEEISPDEFIEKNTKQVGSLILFNDWNETREAKELKAQELTTEIKNMSKGKTMREEARKVIAEKEQEAAKITASLNRPEYKPYKVVAHNKSLPAKNNVYCINQAALMELEVLGNKYIVLHKKYCVATTA